MPINRQCLKWNKKANQIWEKHHEWLDFLKNIEFRFQKVRNTKIVWGLQDNSFTRISLIPFVGTVEPFLML